MRLRLRIRYKLVCRVLLPQPLAGSLSRDLGAVLSFWPI